MYKSTVTAFSFIYIGNLKCPYIKRMNGIEVAVIVMILKKLFYKI